MKQLTIKELAPYLPYGVKANLTRRMYERYNIYLMGLTISYSSTLKEYWIKKDDVSYGLCDVQLILRPLSDLTKEIEHNGERFVPIVKLLDLLDESDYIDYIIEGGKFYDYKLQVDDDWNHCVQFNNNDVCLCFSYDSNTNSFMLSTNINGIEWCTISNQLELFQKLHEWHFDLYSLIDDNLAIDINTI